MPRPSTIAEIRKLPTYHGRRFHPDVESGQLVPLTDKSCPRSSQNIAQAAHIRGRIVSTACDRCSGGNTLRFADCVVLEGYMKGRCTNCHWKGARVCNLAPLTSQRLVGASTQGIITKAATVGHPTSPSAKPNSTGMQTPTRFDLFQQLEDKLQQPLPWPSPTAFTKGNTILLRDRPTAADDNKTHRSLRTRQWIEQDYTWGSVLQRTEDSGSRPCTMTSSMRGGDNVEADLDFQCGEAVELLGRIEELQADRGALRLQIHYTKVKRGYVRLLEKMLDDEEREQREEVAALCRMRIQLECELQESS